VQIEKATKASRIRIGSPDGSSATKEASESSVA
jgi:hypothetical protein